MQDLASAFRAEELKDNVIVPPVYLWVDAYEAWVTANNKSQSPSSFYPQLREFLQDTVEWDADILFTDDTQTKIQYSRMRTDLINARSNQDRIDDMKLIWQMIEDSGLDAFAWSYYFGYNSRDE